MHRKKPRNPPTPPEEILNNLPLGRRIPAPPASGFSRVAVILAVYAACITFISIVGVATAAAIFWLLRGTPIWSGPGFIIYAVGMVTFLWPALYLIGELDRWRKRGRGDFR